MSIPPASPRKLVELLGIQEPDEIDIEAVAQYCSATVLYQPLTGCEARIIGTKDRAIITVNSSSTRGRQRFSAAHELGHWMLDRGRTAFACTQAAFRSEWASKNAEARANQFAAELLMPDAIFVRFTKGLPVTFATVEKLATAFQTSRMATAIRTVQLGMPSMVVYSEREIRKWFVRGPDVPEAIWPREQPTSFTVAADLFRNRPTRTPNEIRADAWLDYRGSKHYLLIEDSVKSGEGVLTLLWWKNEEQLIDVTRFEDGE